MNSKGFSILEMLVSTAIFLFVILAVYSLFDQGRWIHLSSERRTNIQGNARAAMESIERDFRMIGYGVPSGSDVGGATTYAQTWEDIFSATVASIGFTADIDNGNTILTANVGLERNDLVFVEDTSHYSGATSGSPIPMLIVSNADAWDDVGVTGIYDSSTFAFDALDTSADVGSPSTFTARRAQVYTLERIFYRLNGDTNGDGVCDQGYPFCKLERAEIRTNNPTLVTAANGDYFLVGTNVVTLSFQYTDLAGATVPTSNAAERASVRRIAVLLRCRDRSEGGPNKWQDVRLNSDIVLRNSL